MRHNASHPLLLLAAATLAVALVGCGGTDSTPVQGGVNGDPLTNPDPNGGLDGSFVPYIPPPPDTNSNDPVPAAPGSDLGLTSDNGHSGGPGTIKDPIIDNSNGQLTLYVDVDVPTGGSLEVGLGGSDTPIQVFTNAPGGSVVPGFDNTQQPKFDSSTGILVWPLVPSGGTGSVYLTLTVKNSQGGITNESSGITLPPGWTVGGDNQQGHNQGF